MILQVICIILLVPAVLICGYYWFLALVALRQRKSVKNYEGVSKHSFAIVIPAHNEEAVISETLGSCNKLDYPEDKYKVIVIADNCTDQTAKIAEQYGAVCLERHDEEHKGKGFALAWAFENISSQNCDALLVLDADCLVDSHALRVFDTHLAGGEKVLQANDAASNPDDSAMSYAVTVGNLIENKLFYAPKSALGLAVFLRGTGFVLHRDILKKFPWEAHSATEDVEYSILLIKKGVRARFVPEVKVKSEFPIERDQLYVQRTRWAGGNLSFGRVNALKLVLEGLLKKQWQLLDAGWTLLVLSRPLVLLELVITVSIALLCVLLFPGPFSSALLLLSLIVLLLQFSYFSLGIVLLGVTPHRLKLLVNTPFVVARLVTISLMGLLGVGKDRWVRTPR